MATLTALHHSATPRLPLPPSPSAYKNGGTPRRMGNSRKTWTISAPVTPLDPRPVVEWRQSINFGGGAGGLGGDATENPQSARRTTYRTLPASPKPSPNSAVPRPRPRPRPRVQPPREPQHPHQRHSFAGSPINNEDDDDDHRNGSQQQHNNRWSSATPTFPPASSPFSSFSPPPVRRADQSPVHPLRSQPRARPASACRALAPGPGAPGMQQSPRPATATFAVAFPPASNKPEAGSPPAAAVSTPHHRRGAGSGDSAATGSTLASGGVAGVGFTTSCGRGHAGKGSQGSNSISVSISSIGSGSVTVVGDPPKGRRRSSPASSVASSTTTARPLKADESVAPPGQRSSVVVVAVDAAPPAARRRRRRHHNERQLQRSPQREQSQRRHSSEDDGGDEGSGCATGLATALRSCWPRSGGGARDRDRERAAAVAAVIRGEQLRRIEAVRDKGLGGGRAVVVERGDAGRR